MLRGKIPGRAAIGPGDEVTLEGFVHRGQVTVIGVTDSVKYEGTNSFERFEYPTEVQGAKKRGAVASAGAGRVVALRVAMYGRNSKERTGRIPSIPVSSPSMLMSPAAPCGR